MSVGLPLLGIRAAAQRVDTGSSNKLDKLSHFTHHFQHPWLDKQGLNALAQTSVRHWEAAEPGVSKHTICAGQVCNPGACQRHVVKMMNGCHYFQDSGWFREPLAGASLPACQPVNYFQLYLSVNTSWQIGHYLFILQQQWALLLFWWGLEDFLLLSASSNPEWMKKSEREH